MKQTMNEQDLDKLLDQMRKPDEMPQLLMARIQKQAQSTPQSPAYGNDNLDQSLPIYGVPKWRSIAATLLVAMGLGYGVGELTQTDSDFETTETLLAMSMESVYTSDVFTEEQQ